MKGIIYGLICPISNSIRYVGQTKRGVKERLKKHRCEHISHKRFTHKDNWISLLWRKGLIRKLTYVVLEKCDETLLNDREIYWIKHFRDNGHDLVNISNGGQWHYGTSQTEEMKGTNGILIRENYKNHPEIKEAISKKLKNYFKINGVKTGKDHHSSVPIIAHNINTKKSITFCNSRICADHFRMSNRYLSRIKNNKKIYKNHIFYFEGQDVDVNDYMPIYNTPKYFKKVIARNIITGETTTFDNINLCGRHFNCRVHGYIKNKTISNDWIFYYKDQDADISQYTQLKYKKNPNSKVTFAYNIVNKEQVKFNNEIDCAKYFGITSGDIIYRIKYKTTTNNWVFYHSNLNIGDYKANVFEIVAIKGGSTINFDLISECAKYFSKTVPQIGFYIKRKILVGGYAILRKKDTNRFNVVEYRELIPFGRANNINIKVTDIISNITKIYESRNDCMLDMSICDKELRRVTDKDKVYKKKYKFEIIK